MKRYLLFAGSRFTPEGGLKDLQAASDDFEEIQKNLRSVVTSEDVTEWMCATPHHNVEYIIPCWWYIYDTQTLQFVSRWFDDSYTKSQGNDELMALEKILRTMLQ